MFNNELLLKSATPMKLNNSTNAGYKSIKYCIFGPVRQMQ